MLSITRPLEMVFCNYEHVLLRFWTKKMKNIFKANQGTLKEIENYIMTEIHEKLLKNLI